MIRFFRASRGLPFEGPPQFEIRASFSDRDILDELFTTLASFGLLTDSNQIILECQSHRDNLTACILYLIQDAQFEFKEHKLPAFLGMDGEGNVSFNGCLESEVLNGDEGIDIIFGIVKTGLRGTRMV